MINIGVAKDFCILDTYDRWTPMYDYSVFKNKI